MQLVVIIPKRLGETFFTQRFGSGSFIFGSERRFLKVTLRY